MYKLFEKDNAWGGVDSKNYYLDVCRDLKCGQYIRGCNVINNYGAGNTIQLGG